MDRCSCARNGDSHATVSSLRSAGAHVFEEADLLDSSILSVKDLPAHILATIASFFRLRDLHSFQCSSRDVVRSAHDDEAMWRATWVRVRENDRSSRQCAFAAKPTHYIERIKAAKSYRESRALQRDLLYTLARI